MGPAVAGYLGEIDEKKVDATAPRKSKEHNKEPESLAPLRRAVNSIPVTPHSRPDKYEAGRPD